MPAVERGRTDARTAPDWRISPDVGQAIQVLPPPLDDLQRRTLAQVGRKVQSISLNHPRLAPILEAAYREGYPYMVARLGDQVQRLSQRAGLPMEPKQALKVTIQVVDALKYAHYNGFFHGALSLDDILVNDRDLVTVLGVGLEQLRLLVDATVVTSDSLLLSPEAAAGKSLGTDADVYASGALLYFLLTGHAPAAGQQVDLSQRIDGVPSELDAVLTRSLAADPVDRYPDLNSLSHDLRMVSHVTARPRATQQRTLTHPTPAPVRQAACISGFPEPLPMPETDMAVFSAGLQMPTLEELPVVEMPEIPEIEFVDWNLMLQPVDVSGLSNLSVELPDFEDLFAAMDPLHAAAKAANEAEQRVQTRRKSGAATPVAKPPRQKAKPRRGTKKS